MIDFSGLDLSVKLSNSIWSECMLTSIVNLFKEYRDKNVPEFVTVDPSSNLRTTKRFKQQPA